MARQKLPLRATMLNLLGHLQGGESLMADHRPGADDNHADDLSHL